MKVKKEDTIAICVRIPKRVYKELEKKKEERGKLSIPEVIREAISHYLRTANLNELPLDATVKEVFSDE